MSILLPTLAVAFAAFCVWLAVRFFNRRELWAKWTLATVVGLPALYVLSFGPACWIGSYVSGGRKILPIIYYPILRLASLERLRNISAQPPKDYYMSTSTHNSMSGGVLGWYVRIGATEGGGHWSYIVDHQQEVGGLVEIERERWKWLP